MAKQGRTFWDLVYDEMPSERGWVTIATFALAGSMLKMTEVHPELWEVELFKTLLTLVIGTAIVNMILAFHFTANKADEVKTQNTAKLADAFKSVSENSAAGPGAPPNDGGSPDSEPGTPATGKPGDPVHIVEEE